MPNQIHLHQTHHTLADFTGILNYLKENFSEPGLHLFPELYLTGYPLQDLVLQRSFIDAYHGLEQQLQHWLLSLPAGPRRALVGGLEYELSESGVPSNIYNVICELVPAEGIKKIYRKRLLPNYDIFDEQKYFSAGAQSGFYTFNHQTFGLLICEDMWTSSFHQLDPCDLLLQEARARKIDLAGLINLSASPFEVTKNQKRLERAKNLSLLFKCPFIYLNRVGGEDEILFDGGSFIVRGAEIPLQLKTFGPQRASWDLGQEGNYQLNPQFRAENTWEGLFSPNLNLAASPAGLKQWSDAECGEVLKALIFGLQEYARKSGFSKFLVALSGGIDSALVLALVKMGLQPGQEVEALYMPSIHSSPQSTELSEQMCRKLGIRLSWLPIKFLHAMVKNNFSQTFPEPFEGLTDENVQSRLRGLLLYTRSNQSGAMVVNTSNKSELAVGYSTQYGDSVGAISLLGDLYKTEVYRLAGYINQHHDSPIPEGIITRGPSAELRDNQLDQDSLPPYERLDAILEGILSYRMGRTQLVELGFDQAEVKKVLQLYLNSEYKRAQFCPIVKIKAKSFGFGYRVPISKSRTYQF
jgi:NAD+ synthase (glutamine-hydrolysing)